MAVTYIGNYGNGSLTQSPTFDIAIPDNATECILGIAYRATTEAANLITAISLDGQTGELVRYPTADPANRDNLVVYRFRGFSVGSGKSFSCTRSGAIYDGAEYMFIFTSGENATTPVKSSAEAVTTGTEQTLTTDAMNSGVNDLVIVFASGMTDAITITGGGQTQVASDYYNDTRYAVGYKTGTGVTDTATATLTKGVVVGVVVSSDAVGSNSASPSGSPSNSDSASSSNSPSASASGSPSNSASTSPSNSSSSSPSASESLSPSMSASGSPSNSGSSSPSNSVSNSPSASSSPSNSASASPSGSTSNSPSASPSGSPSASPSGSFDPVSISKIMAFLDEDVDISGGDVLNVWYKNDFYMLYDDIDINNFLAEMT
jgi:hypothetical protein